MSHTPPGECGESHTLKFHGTGKDFFFICLINVVLSLITCGIYIPWAVVRCRRYIYENMELNGACFSYHAKGGAILLSWFAISVAFLIISFVEYLITGSDELQIGFWIFILISPCMAVKSLNYHAAMTELNNVRFGFHCSTLRAWWLTMGMPILILIGCAIVIMGFGKLMGTPTSMNGVIATIVLGAIAWIIICCALYGLVYRNWIQLFANNFQFGIHRFNVDIKIARCVTISIISMLIMVPFIATIFAIIYSTLNNAGLGGLIFATSDMKYSLFLLYTVGILLSTAYLFSALRNYAFNNLTLAGDIRFQSSLTFFNVAVNLLIISLFSMLTFGLAYPWLKVHFLRYQIENTMVIGDLDKLELKNDERPVENGFFARISRGTASALPFL